MIPDPPALDRRRDPWGLLALAGLAFALRGWLAPHVPIHENLHGFSILSGTLTQWEGVRSTWLDLLRLLHVRFGAVFFVTAVVSALAPPLLALLTHELLGSRRAALFAGLALALHPLAVRLGGSESEQPFASTLFLAGTWLAVRATRSTGWGRALVLVGAAAALSAAVGAHVLTPALAAAAAVLVLPALRRGRAWPVLAALAVPLAVAIARGAALAGQGRGTALLADPDPWGAALRQALDLALLGGLEQTRSPLAFQVAALVGLVLIARRRAAVALALAGALLALQVPFAVVIDAPGGPSALRHLSLALPLWSLAAGAALAFGLDLLERRLPARAVPVLTLAGALAVPAGLASGLPFVTHQGTADRAYPVLEACVDAAPAWARVVALKDPTVQHVASLPWIAAKRPQWRPVAPTDLAREAAASRDPIVLLIDPQCAVTLAPGGAAPPPAVHDTPWGPLAEPCATALNALPWQAVTRVDLPNEPHHGLAWLTPFRPEAPVGCLQWPPR